MNEKLCKTLRRIAKTKKEYRGLKKEVRKIEAKKSIKNIEDIKVRNHKIGNPIPPTWPKTENQLSQNRPLIIESPVRFLRRNKIYINPYLPKNELDSTVTCFLTTHDIKYSI